MALSSALWHRAKRWQATYRGGRLLAGKLEQRVGRRVLAGSVEGSILKGTDIELKELRCVRCALSAVGASFGRAKGHTPVAC